MEVKKGTGLAGVSILFLKSIIGYGIVSIPAVMSKIGYLLSCILILFTAIVTIYSLYVLSLCVEDDDEKKEKSFFYITEKFFPGYGFIPELFIILKGLGVCTGYLILIGNEMVDVSKEKEFYVFMHKKTFWIPFLLLLISPFTFSKKISSLKHISLFGLFSVIYLQFTLSVDLFRNKEFLPKIKAFIWNTKNIIKEISIVVFSFGCHQSFFPVYNEAKDKRPIKMLLSFFISSFLSAGAYISIGISGYLRYGIHVNRNILSNLPKKEGLFLIMRLSYVFFLLFSFPLQIFPVRNSIEKIFFKKKTALRHFLVTIFLILIPVLASLLLKEIDIAQKIVGTFVTPILCFILPGVIHIKIQKKHCPILSVFLVIFGIFVLLISLIGFFL